MAKIRELTAGTEIKFGGKQWILLKPEDGYMILKKSAIKKFYSDYNDYFYFNPSFSNSAPYYFNNDFYNTFTEKEKSVIKSRVWNVGQVKLDEGGYGGQTPTLSIPKMKLAEAKRQVTCYIGLLSVSEWYEMGEIYRNAQGYVLGGSNNSEQLYLINASGTSVGPSSFWTVAVPQSYAEKPILVYGGPRQIFTFAPTLAIDEELDVLNGEVSYNNAPTITLNTSTNNSLYENDILQITGTAFDADADQSVTVYYQINNEARKVLATNLSQTQIALSKQLTFKGGKLYDGDTALTGTLADGVAHTLKVWAEDSEKASSVIVERTFYVVPNRAPLLTVDAVVPSGVVDADKFKISGTSSDQDANANVTVTRRINGSNAVEIYNGTGGAWEFEVSLAQLQVGENTIVIEVIDNYSAKTSKIIKLNKNELKTPILQSVARYKITPPTGSAKGVLLFIERDETLDLKVELSMTLAGEQEQYETLTPDNTAPMPNTVGIVEDTYFHEVTEPKDNIILKLSSTRPDVTVNQKIHLISGAVE